MKDHLNSNVNAVARVMTFLAAVGFAACVEEEPVEMYAQYHQPRLVVEGMITSEYRPQMVRLSYSTGYDQVNSKSPAATGADISITDGLSLFPLFEVGDGVYVSDSLAGVPGTVYTLTVRVDGQDYQGSDTMMPIVGHEPLTFVEEAGQYEFPYRPHLFGFDLANRYDVLFFKADSVVQADSGVPNGNSSPSTGPARTLFTHPSLEPNGVFQFVATDHLRFSGTSWWVEQRKFSISDAYYDYLRAVFSETDWRGSLMDTTPGNVPSNMDGGAVGFFSACEVDVLIYPYPTVD